MPTNIDNRRVVRIEQTIVETPTVKTLVFKDSLSHTAKPGQFLMVWIPRIEEIPMSVMINSKDGYAAVTIRKSGVGSTALFERETGDLVGLRGPYGNSYTFKKTYEKNIDSRRRDRTRAIIKIGFLCKEVENSKYCGYRCKNKGEVFFENIAKKIIQDID